MYREMLWLFDWGCAIWSPWLHGELDLPRISEDEIPGQLTLFDR